MREENSKPHRDLWQALSGGGDRNTADRAARAVLRRLGTMPSDEGDIIDLFAPLRIQPFRVYQRQLGLLNLETDRELEQLAYAAVAACAIAWIDEDAPLESMGTLLGPSAGSDRPRFAEVRFTRLLRCDTPERLLLEVRRMVRILGGRAPVGDLGRTLANWNRPSGLKSRRQWAFDYWNKYDLTSSVLPETTTA